MTRVETLLSVARQRREVVEAELAALDARITAHAALVDSGQAPSPLLVGELVSPCSLDHRGVE